MTLQFIEEVSLFDKEKSAEILLMITDKVNKRPALLEMSINQHQMYALSKFIQHTPVTIGQLINNPYRDGEDLEIVILAVKRHNGDFILLPEETTELHEGDHLLFASTRPSLDRLKTIVNHYYELYYVIHGKEEQRFTLFGKKF
jgi:Trk K+ transport system NAD-binding subunit